VPAKVRPEPVRNRRPLWLLGGILALAVLGTAGFKFLRARTATPAGPGFSASNAVVLDEAAKFWDTKPDDALRLAESVLAEEPSNPRAWSLKLLCLYHQNRMVDFGQALQALQDQGVRREDLLANRAFRTVLERDRHRLPEDLRKSLLNPTPTENAK